MTRTPRDVITLRDTTLLPARLAARADPPHGHRSGTGVQTRESRARFRKDDVELGADASDVLARAAESAYVRRAAPRSPLPEYCEAQPRQRDRAVEDLRLGF